MTRNMLVDGLHAAAAAHLQPSIVVCRITPWHLQAPNNGGAIRVLDVKTSLGTCTLMDNQVGHAVPLLLPQLVERLAAPAGSTNASLTRLHCLPRLGLQASQNGGGIYLTTTQAYEPVLEISASKLRRNKVTDLVSYMFEGAGSQAKPGKMPLLPGIP